MSNYLLGISAYYHDSAAALIRDGLVIAAAQEERFSRKKFDERFPARAAAYCLNEAGITLSDVAAVVFYDKPFVKFQRLLETYLTFAPRGFRSFYPAMIVWLKEKLFLKVTLKKALCELSGLSEQRLPPLLFSQHHRSHAASAFYPSPFQQAAVLCLDGVGEWATTSLWRGDGASLDPQWEIHFPHSLGLLYSAFTYYTGFRVNSGEYKLMGLAPYGEPKYADLIRRELIDIKEDGTYRLNMRYFDFATGLRMTSNAFHRLFGGPPRQPESPVTQKDMDLAASVQVVTEEVVLRLARTAHRELGSDNLCLAGGVALNCVANGRLRREGPFARIWAQPAAGDAGAALGAALAAWHEHFAAPRQVGHGDAMAGSYLGPACAEHDIEVYLRAVGARFERMAPQALPDRVAELIEQGNVVGWVQGRMEFGPRALGARSILGDARSPKMQSVMNLKIKFRESFRPFAPAVLAEDVSEYFEWQGGSPYMLFTADIQGALRRQLTEEERARRGIALLAVARSTLPAVTHVDYSARLQTVHADTNPRFHALLAAFKQRTGCGVLINTSFNVRGEPIVCNAEDAYRCFMTTEMDYLVLESFVLAKAEQPPFVGQAAQVELD